MAEEIAFELEGEVSAASRRETQQPSTIAGVRRRSSSTNELAALREAADVEEDGCSFCAGDSGHANGSVKGFANGVTSDFANGSANGVANGYDKSVTSGRTTRVVADGRLTAGGHCEGSRLYSFEECPPQLQYNKFVRGGYRAGMSYAQCLRSVCSYHNETGNILTHLLPAILISSSMLLGWLPPWPGFEFGFYTNLLPILICLCGSVSYHTFMAHHWKYKQWLMLDVCGIFLMFLSGVHVVLWWGLRCFPRVRLAYTVTYYSLAALTIVAAVRAKSAVTRALPMLLLFLVRVSVMFVRLYLRAASVPATRHYIMMEVWSALGGSINAARVPERWFQPKSGQPGRFDTWLNSHNVMHFLVVFAMAHLFRGATLDYEQFISKGGPCSS